MADEGGSGKRNEEVKVRAEWRGSRLEAAVEGATLEGATLEGATLEGATLEGAGWQQQRTEDGDQSGGGQPALPLAYVP